MMVSGLVPRRRGVPWAVVIGSLLAAPPLAAQGDFSPTDGMTAPRFSHTATRLLDGRVLVVGGSTGISDLGSAEIYNPVTEMWGATAGLFGSRLGHTATLLNDGRVLVGGGAGLSNAAAVYSPASGTWDSGGTMVVPRSFHSATRLADGRVLVAGGANVILGEHGGSELYTPATNSWSSTGFMAESRRDHTTTLLNDGRVLLAGGRRTFPSNTPLTGAELYSPASGAWSPTDALTLPRWGHTATLLNDGRVLVAGGTGASPLVSAEIYNPASGTFSNSGSLGTARTGHTATLLADGTVLIAGGFDGANRLATAEVYDPASGTFSPVADTMSSARENHTATLLLDGRTLVAGGRVVSGATSSADLYDPAGQVPACTLSIAPTYQGGTLNLQFTLGANVPTTWNVWLSIGNVTPRVWSLPVPAISPPFSFPVPLPLPPSGRIGVLSTMTTPSEGILCSDWETVDTGS